LTFDVTKNLAFITIFNDLLIIIAVGGFFSGIGHIKKVEPG